MRADRSDAVPTDGALDAEIRAALAVEPSPAFHARVRARIADEGPVRGHRRLWTYSGLAAIGTIGAIVVIAAFVPWSSPRAPRTAPHAMLAARASVGFAMPVPSRARSRLRSAKAFALHGADLHGVAQRGVAPGGVAQRMPEVLLAPDETRALRALISGVRDGRIDLRAVAMAAPAPAVMELAPIETLAIPLIVIAPVEGVRQ